MLTPSELLLLSAELAPRLKRDFLTDLPTEIALYILSFVDDPRTLARASEVSQCWRRLLTDEQVWKRECEKYAFASWLLSDKEAAVADRPGGSSSKSNKAPFSYREHFKESWLTEQSWRRGGHISRTYHSPGLFLPHFAKFDLTKPTPINFMSRTWMIIRWRNCNVCGYGFRVDRRGSREFSHTRLLC